MAGRRPSGHTLRVRPNFSSQRLDRSPFKSDSSDLEKDTAADLPLQMVRKGLAMARTLADRLTDGDIICVGP